MFVKVVFDKWDIKYSKLSHKCGLVHHHALVIYQGAYLFQMGMFVPAKVPVKTINRLDGHFWGTGLSRPVHMVDTKGMTSIDFEMLFVLFFLVSNFQQLHVTGHETLHCHGCVKAIICKFVSYKVSYKCKFILSGLQRCLHPGSMSRHLI